ncbi:DUF4259 domain-containing protein [Streptomyces sp. NPDC002730]|uniref:DUF4259 domain-containing protein n=1 Tax=Streptomyces sp. NPDC002730 TaxID=3364662 RepID=UPI0036B2F432
MGTWGIGPFDNDDAADFAVEPTPRTHWTPPTSWRCVSGGQFVTIAQVGRCPSRDHWG